MYTEITYYVTAFIAFINFIYFEGERDLPHMKHESQVHYNH